MSTIAKTTTVAPSVVASSVEDLRRTFENAFAQIRRKSEAPSPSKIPIAARRQAMVASDPAAEKRALTDAARALAQLWKISPTLVR